MRRARIARNGTTLALGLTRSLGLVLSLGACAGAELPAPSGPSPANPKGPITPFDPGASPLTGAPQERAAPAMSSSSSSSPHPASHSGMHR